MIYTWPLAFRQCCLRGHSHIQTPRLGDDSFNPAPPPTPPNRQRELLQSVLIRQEGRQLRPSEISRSMHGEPDNVLPILAPCPLTARQRQERDCNITAVKCMLPWQPSLWQLGKQPPRHGGSYCSEKKKKHNKNWTTKTERQVLPSLSTTSCSAADDSTVTIYDPPAVLQLDFCHCYSEYQSNKVHRMPNIFKKLSREMKPIISPSLNRSVYLYK